MPQPGKGMIRVRYTLTYESDIDLSSYPDMTPEQAVQHELEGVSESEIIELMATCDEDELTVVRDVQFIQP